MHTTIVSAYNSKVDLTREFLDTMQRTTQGQEVSMILVNGGCETKIEHPFIRKRIDLERNIGFCNTLNHGLREALFKSSAIDYVFFVGNDSFPVDNDWLPRLIKLQQQAPAWMACPANDNPGMEFRKDCYIAEHDDYWEASWFPSIAWLMPAFLVSKVGMLDEGYEGTGMFSDNDYCDRVKARGGNIVVSKNIMLRHLCSQEGSAIGTQGKDMQLNAEYYRRRVLARAGGCI